jgi:hypothetical protein
MLDLIINSIGVLCVVLLVWSLTRGYLRKININNQADTIAIEDYLQKITHITGASTYDIFRISAEEWRISADRIDRDFKRYLSTLTVPYYVKDFIRKGQKHIDEMYRGKHGEYTDRRLLLFYSFLVLLFWGGVVFLSLYVFPHILPEDTRMMPGIGQP